MHDAILSYCLHPGSDLGRFIGKSSIEERSMKKNSTKSKGENSIHRKKCGSKKTITIQTPCSVSDVESFLHIISHEGHWHDAVVFGEKGQIRIEFEDDSSV